MAKKKNKDVVSLILVVVLVLVMAYISFYLDAPRALKRYPSQMKITPAIVFTVGPLQVTSTIVNTWIMIVVLGYWCFFCRPHLQSSSQRLSKCHRMAGQCNQTA